MPVAIRWFGAPAWTSGICPDLPVLRPRVPWAWASACAGMALAATGRAAINNPMHYTHGVATSLPAVLHQ